MHELIGIVIQLHHLLHLFQLQNLFIRKPSGMQYLIGRPVLIYDFILLCLFPYFRALQHLQKTKLKLLRLHGVHITKGFLKALIPLKGKTCNQVKMYMNISVALYFLYYRGNAAYVCASIDFPQSIRVCCLHTDFQLGKSGSKAF